MRIVPILLACLGILTPQVVAAGQRGLLWRVVQACVVNHQITGASFPCLAVSTPRGVDTGYAVIRPPDEGIRIIVTPTIRTIGIEATRLRGVGAPNYFQDAWDSRHFVTDELAKKPQRSDLALAVNSKPGRSQDQLHIHVACIRQDVQRAIVRSAAAIRDQPGARIRVLPGAPYYTAYFEASRDLTGLNLFDRVAASLKVSPDEMDDVTIVIVGAAPSGFVVLARKKLPHSLDEPHGEALLDPTCDAFKTP